jgi:hypothetical protein
MSAGRRRGRGRYFSEQQMHRSPQDPDDDQYPDHCAEGDQQRIDGRAVGWGVFFPVVSHDRTPHPKPAPAPTMAGTKAEQIPRIFPVLRRVVSVSFRLETSSSASTPVGKSL